MSVGAVAYQIRIHTGNWHETDFEAYELVSHNRPNDARKLYCESDVQSLTAERDRLREALEAFVAYDDITDPETYNFMAAYDDAVKLARKALEGEA